MKKKENAHPSKGIGPPPPFTLIIGIGNPSPKYEHTYHNIGVLMADFLLAQNDFPIPIMKSDVFMNESGAFAMKVLSRTRTKPEHLLVIHDESDLTIGSFKLSYGRGAAGHKGVENIMTALGTKNFWRLRIGIRPHEAISENADARANKNLHPIRSGGKAGEFVLKKISKEHRILFQEVFRNALAKIRGISN